MKFAIYHREREYAREMGDPKLAEVAASTKEEAERVSAHLGMTGVIAVLLSPAALAVPPPRKAVDRAHRETSHG